MERSGGGSSLGFEVNDLGVIQVLATKGPVDLPLDRERLLDLGDGRGPHL
jgi:hypothetical protein